MLDNKYLFKILKNANPKSLSIMSLNLLQCRKEKKNNNKKKKSLSFFSKNSKKVPLKKRAQGKQKLK